MKGKTEIPTEDTFPFSWFSLKVKFFFLIIITIIESILNPL